jgi:hypothetical protein
MTLWQDDLVLGSLGSLPGPLGDLVRAFPGRAVSEADPHWMDNWFQGVIEGIAAARGDVVTTHISSEAAGADLSPLRRPAVAQPVRLLSLQPQYFRGFRRLDHAIDLSADLVAIEGRNSSGKTSISEALEWLITGSLSRRTSGQYGNARELANCISNEFRPKNETTWVQGSFVVNGTIHVVRRVLTVDYGGTTTSVASSDLTIDDQHFPNENSAKVLELLFGGVPPLLMQHTLRQFVHAGPADRRQYFERLLQIDELTALVEKAVVGDARLRDFKAPGGDEARERWLAFTEPIHDVGLAREALEAATKDPDARPKALQAFLVRAAIAEFALPGEDLDAAKVALAQRLARQRSQRVPLLGAARIDAQAGNSATDAASLQEALRALADAGRDLLEARGSEGSPPPEYLAVSEALRVLKQAGLVEAHGTEAQTCPVCAFDPPTLTLERLNTIAGWQPAADIRRTRVAAFERARESVVREVRRFEKAFQSLQRVPLAAAALPDPQEEILRQATSGVRDSLASLSAVLSDALSGLAGLRAFVEAAAVDADIGERTRVLADVVLGAVRKLPSAVRAHSIALTGLETVAASITRTDQDYRRAELWVQLADTYVDVSAAMTWHSARQRAQQLLEEIRSALIRFRAEIIADAGRVFTQEMSDVWDILRKDTPARFAGLRIPSPRGKGYKIEIELKARVEDATSGVEVDALRVFSESQINAVGIAAYVTRARRLGHRLLFFDDPVQSMDDEHLRSFSSALIDRLLSDGFQVIVLTHNDLCQRTIADHHATRASFVTLLCRPSRRQGCQVDEGNRRISERLRRAEKAAEEGELGRAWFFVRLAIERIYLLAKKKADASFKSESWQNHTAESMWNEGAGVYLESMLPGCGSDMKAILDLTAAGAHDKAPAGETVLRESAAFIRRLRVRSALGD